MRNLLSNSIKVCLFVFVILGSTKTFGQFNCPNANRCTSKDLSIVGARLVGGACACSSSGTQTASLFMSINNTTGSIRTSFAFFGSIVYSTGTHVDSTRSISGCGGNLPANTTTEIPVGVTITYRCTQTLSLSNVYLAWTDAAGETAPRCAEILADACVHIAPKCGTAPVIPITPLLSFSADTSKPCNSNSDGSITIHPLGGDAKYSVTLKGTPDVTHSDVDTLGSTTFTGLSSGTYTFVVTDAAACTYSSSVTLDFKFCCTAPTVGTNPSGTSVCAGDSAFFTATPNGGNPPPTVQWQISTTAGGSTFTNLTEGSPYKNVTSTTLRLKTSTALNGFKYRAVFTSAGCTSATSNAATLTVYAVPSSPATTYHGPASCNDSTFSVEVTNVFANATYTIKDKNGDNIATVQPGNSIHTTTTNNITFSHIPAGSGYQVSVLSDNGCSTDAGTICGTPDLVTRKASSLTTELATETETTVKAYPNPFSDRVKFVVTTPVAGRGNLEVYNMMGQRVKTVYQGFINSGTQTFELSLPRQQIANLVYVLRIGDKKMSGKLLQINQ